jgi:hypothetical protein
MLKIHQSIHDKLDYFLKINKIPNLLFHGPNGSGKKTIVKQFMDKIYTEPKDKQQYILEVNCGMGKGIKFIRDELKFFAKTNIDSSKPGLFKTIILYNVENLTIDGQSALRRCIEVYSFTTRFFMVTNNKYTLLKPILSRFCEIWIPLPFINGVSTNLYELYNDNIIKCTKQCWLYKQIKKYKPTTSNDLVTFSNTIYDKGLTAMHLLKFIEQYEEDEKIKHVWLIYFDKIRQQIRNENLLIFMILQFYFFRSNYTLENMLFI